VYRGKWEPNEYDPPEALALDSTYYWRIDEVDDSNGYRWKGLVWQFTTANYIIVDDMESYNKQNNWIFDTWDDGWANNSGSELDLGQAPGNPVHAGRYSMLYSYDNADTVGFYLDYYSEIEIDMVRLKVGSGWAGFGVRMLTLFFCGDPNNDADSDYEQMYVGLEDTDVHYAQIDYGDQEGEDMNDVKVAEWHEWNIILSDFSGVDANNVKELYIGFGVRGNPYGGTPGGSGLVYFDDIRLYPPKCVPKHGPLADLDGDCIVYLGDLWMMAEDWLRTDAILDTQEPDPNGLVGWWELDEGDGNTVTDSSISGNNGTAEGEYSWVAGHIGPYAVEFTDGRVLVPDDGNTPELRPTDKVSVCAWVYYSKTQNHSARVVVKGPDNKETFGLEVTSDNLMGFLVGDANGESYNVDSVRELWHDESIHLAGTFDGVTETLSCYVNGRLRETDNDVNFVSEQGLTLSQDTAGLAIGNRSDDMNL